MPHGSVDGQLPPTENAGLTAEPDTECRICRGGEEEEALWKPCDCMYQGVHISCLERWLETRSGAYANQLTCEVWPRTGCGRPASLTRAFSSKPQVCQADFAVCYQERLVLREDKLCSDESCRNYRDMMTLVLVTLASIFVTVLTWRAEDDSDGQVLIVIMMSGSILMTLFTMYTVYQRWKSANSMRMLVLDETRVKNPRVVPVVAE